MWCDETLRLIHSRFSIMCFPVTTLRSVITLIATMLLLFWFLFLIIIMAYKPLIHVHIISHSLLHILHFFTTPLHYTSIVFFYFFADFYPLRCLQFLLRLCKGHASVHKLSESCDAVHRIGWYRLEPLRRNHKDGLRIQTVSYSLTSLTHSMIIMTLSIIIVNINLIIIITAIPTKKKKNHRSYWNFAFWTKIFYFQS